MPVAPRFSFPAGPAPGRRCALAGLTLALAACGAGAADGRCASCVSGQPTAPTAPTAPPPFSASHHGIVRGTVRNAAGAPVAGVTPYIYTQGPSYAAGRPPAGLPTLHDLTGATLTTDDGSFRLSYTVGLGPDPSATAVQVGVLRANLPPALFLLPTPRPLSEPADSVTVTVVLRAPVVP